MRYCPNCRIDYDDDIEECVTCGGPLVDGSCTDMFEELSEESWVELDPLGTLTHAKSVLEALDEEGIPCFIEAIFGGGTETYSATILVQDDDFETALAIQQSLVPPGDDELLLDPDADDY